MPRHRRAKAHTAAVVVWCPHHTLPCHIVYIFADFFWLQQTDNINFSLYFLGLFTGDAERMVQKERETRPEWNGREGGGGGPWFEADMDDEMYV